MHRQTIHYQHDWLLAPEALVSMLDQTFHLRSVK
jgi:hypothetical protein